ncbi:hypothetical protein [Anaerotalea alkaliphila]|uniref:Uncharacterized protein n=1 Tax=Anaerotalea alkaliphila TaxID=2662126 RepID=A0A7X5HTI0_9FIRM|nr:hypothetical protein [Anaerotalea alkaliphila]NDL66383.1 hypothetical protein [Anaerotalea alkaliphila]
MIENSLWKLSALLLLVALLYVAPLASLFERQGDITYERVRVETAALTDRVRNLGVLEKDQWEAYLRKVSATGEVYQVELEHQKRSYTPVLDGAGEPTGDWRTVYAGSYDGDITGELALSGRYPLALGDFFYVTVRSTSRSKDQALKSMLFGRSGAFPAVYTRNGGMVRHEDD